MPGRYRLTVTFDVLSSRRGARFTERWAREAAASATAWLARRRRVDGLVDAELTLIERDQDAADAAP